jgi:periplasmic divalent cation tolerance protein
MLRQVFCTCPDGEVAERVGSALLEERLVACVQSFPVQSRYWWRGSIETASEVMLVMKTTAEHMGPLIARVRQLHPYEVPEVVAVPIEEGNPAYLEWLAAETETVPCP